MRRNCRRISGGEVIIKYLNQHLHSLVGADFVSGDIMLEDRTKQHNAVQKICGCCHKDLVFLSGTGMQYANLKIKRGYCNNKDCMVYNQVQDVEFVEYEAALNLGHKYYDEGGWEVATTRWGVASDAVHQSHKYTKSKKKIISDKDSNRERIRARENRDRRFQARWAREDTEDKKLRQQKSDLLAAIRAKVLDRQLRRDE